MDEDGRDPWALWLRSRRDAGDPELMRLTEELLLPVRDQVLASAALESGDVLLDVGCGDGLIAFGALAATGPSGRVIFSDVSAQLLDRCRAVAQEEGLLDRCQFVQASAADLGPIPDGSVDVVTTRSVLIYIQDKDAAFRAFHRVLRPGGRLSIFEPINSFELPGRERFLLDFDITPVADLARPVQALYNAIQPAGRDPIDNFDERDLLRSAEAAGFPELHLRLDIALEPTVPPRPWEAFARTSPNPLVPTLEEAMNQALPPGQARRLADYLRPLVSQGKATRRRAVAYLRARKES